MVSMLVGAHLQYLLTSALTVCNFFFFFYRSTSCKVTNPPVHNLQFLINRELGKAQFHVEKIGQPVSTENGETGRKMILGSFALVYVVDGHVRIGIDENHAQGHARVLSKGHTLYIERDEEASPTNLMIQASDEKGGVGNHDLGKLITFEQICV